MERPNLLGRALRTGGAIYVANVATMMLASMLRRRSPWSGVNAFGSAFGIGGRRSADRFDRRATPLALVANLGHLLAWGAAYELALARLGRGGSLATDAADAVIGYWFDRFVMPRRLMRNARRALGRRGLLALYGSLALATAASRRLEPMFSDMTDEERKNLAIVREYMEIAYDPKRASATAVAHLCAPGNRFIAPSTFPEVHTLEEYADDHAKIMKSLDDLHFVSFDVFFAAGDRVCLRYTAEGTHKGAPHGELAPTGRTARWSAVGTFRVENGKIVEFVKDWNKLQMWEQLGWPVEECLTGERPEDVEPLAPPLH